MGIHLDSALDRPQTVKCLLMQRNHSLNRVLSSLFPSADSYSALFDYRGYKRFFRRIMLETSDFLKDDCLKINCTVGVVVSEIDCPRLHSIHVPASDIGSHFGMLLENEDGSDITFNVSGEKFRAHRLVLAARSPVFESEFLDVAGEEDRDIEVTDMEPKVFKVNFLTQCNITHCKRTACFS